MRINEFEEKLPSVKTMTVGAIAHKHNVTVKSIRQQLTKGIAIEKEHTSDPAIAKEIALDHLAELPDYYDRLEKVEEEEVDERIGKVKGGYRLYSKKGKNLGTFDTRGGAEKHEREVQYFKHKK